MPDRGYPTEPAWSVEQQNRIALIAESFQRLVGYPLADPADAENLWHAPRVIVAHGREDDPIFFYGNRLALSLFDTDFAAFIQMPSRLSAEPLVRAERERLLQRVGAEGFIDDYSGVRISASGRRFRIERAVVWNLIDRHNICHGQAATFAHWIPLSDSTGA